MSTKQAFRSIVLTIFLFISQAHSQKKATTQTPQFDGSRSLINFSEFDTYYGDISALCNSLSKICITEEPMLEAEHIECAALIAPIILKSMQDLTPSLNKEMRYEIAEKLIRSKQWPLTVDHIKKIIEKNPSLQPKTKEFLKKIYKNIIEEKESIPPPLIKAVKIAILEKYSSTFKRLTSAEKQALSTYGLNCELCKVSEVPLNLHEKILTAAYGVDSIYEVGDELTIQFIMLIMIMLIYAKYPIVYTLYHLFAFAYCLRNIINHSQKIVV
jgi:hypothetical protein